MNRLTEYIELNEATAEEVHTKYYSDIGPDVFNKLYLADPTSKQNKLGKYSKWVIFQYIKDPEIVSDLSQLSTTLNIFDKANKLGKTKTKDITKFKTFDDLKDELLSLNLYAAFKSNKEGKSDIRADGKKVYDDSDWLIVSPKTYPAMCFYGAGTKWCNTSSGNGDAGANFFNRYNSLGDTYVVISKNKTDSENRPIKYQFNFGANEFKDSKDLTILPKDRRYVGILYDIILEKTNKGVSDFFNEQHNTKEWGNVTYLISASQLRKSIYDGNSLNLSGEGSHTTGTDAVVFSLRGTPNSVEKLKLYRLDIINLNGCPKKLDVLSIGECQKLESLVGCSEDVDWFSISGCSNLKSLNRCPIRSKQYSISNCLGLNNVVGLPSEINGNLHLLYNRNLKDLAGLPKKISGDLIFQKNGITPTKEDILQICLVGGEIKL